MIYNIKLEDIVKKYPFMYKVGGKIYYIGDGVFGECSDNISVEYYNRYRESVESVGRDNLEATFISGEDIDALIYYFRKIMSRSDYESNNTTDRVEVNRRTQNFISSLSPDMADELKNQMVDFVNVFKNFYYPRLLK